MPLYERTKLYSFRYEIRYRMKWSQSDSFYDAWLIRSGFSGIEFPQEEEGIDDNQNQQPQTGVYL